MTRLSRIDGAIDAVIRARKLCPGDPTYTGRAVFAFDEPCPNCHQRRNGDGGTCVITGAEHQAIKDIERAIS